MRCAGRIALGNCGAVFTGQAVLLSPARTAFTSAMLSFLVRPLTVGTAMGGTFAVESLPPALPALEGGSSVAAAPVREVDELATGRMAAAATLVGDPAGGMTSPPGDGRASLLAAQASDASRTKGTSTLIEEYLRKKLRCIS